MKQIQTGIFRSGERLYTRTEDEQAVYGESFSRENGEIYRNWKPSRSKAGAAVMKGFDLGLEKDMDVLYLGAASGTTVSHFSDILTDGFLFAVEVSDTTARDLLELAERRKNIAPILENAREPEKYSDIVTDVDTVFQDISQSDQAEIFIRNCRKFLNEDGVGLLSVKARSISSSREKEKIFDEVREKLGEDFNLVEETELEPYEKAHLLVKVEKK